MIIDILLSARDDKTQNMDGYMVKILLFSGLIAPARGSSSVAARPIHNSPAAGWSTSNCCYPAPPPAEYGEKQPAFNPNMDP